jgi:hypothetical protein
VQRHRKRAVKSKHQSKKFGNVKKGTQSLPSNAKKSVA